MSTATKAVWRIAGEEVASCNCAWGCPCQFNALPTTGRCEGFVAWDVTSGHYADLRLDGLRFALVASWPGAIHEGNGTVQLFIDEKAAPEQRRALLEISSGKAGGTFFEIFSAVCSTKLDPIYTSISFEADRERRRARVRVGSAVESTIEPIKNPVTGAEHRARINLPFGFEYKEAEVCNTVHLKASCGPKLTLDHRNTHGHLNAFDLSNL